MVMVTAIVRWLANLPDLNHTEDINQLLAESQENSDTQLLLHFLYDVGLPYVGLRQQLRKASSREMREESLPQQVPLRHLVRPRHLVLPQHHPLSAQYLG